MSRTRLFVAAGTFGLLATVARADEPKDLAEVVVTAAPYVVSMDSTTTSVNVIKREELDLAPSAGLGDVLAHLPGVRSSFFGPGASRPVIRGLSGPRVLVLTNGVGLIDASSVSPDHQVASDPQEAERIEVLRGPSALAYGGSAIGGVVNVIDDRIPSTHEGGLHGRALGAYSTGDDGVSLSGALRAGLANGFNLTLDAAHRRTDDYEVPVDPISRPLAARLALPAPSRHNTTVPNSFVDLDAYGAGLSWVGDAGWGGASVKRTESRYGSPAEADVRIELEQTRIDARGGADLTVGPFEKLKLTAGWADYKHTEFEGGEASTTFLSEGFEGRLELVQPNLGGWQGAVGVQALSRDLDVIGEEALLPKTKIKEAGVFTLQRYDRNGWGLEGGLRLDTRSLRSERGDRDFTNLSASAAAFMRPAEGWFLGLSLSRTSRAPTQEELFSFGAHPATGAFEVGDASLGKEVSYSADGSVHYAGGPWLLDLHAFYVDYDSFIDQVPTGAVEAESGFPVFRYVKSGAKFHGFEVEAGYDAWKRGEKSFRLEAGADYVRGRTGFGAPARIPPWSVTGRGIFEGGWWTGTLEVRHVGQQDRVATFESPTDDYTMVNASLVVRPFRTRPQLKVFLDGHNLTDTEAREHASFLKDVAPLPGRSFRLGLGYRF